MKKIFVLSIVCCACPEFVSGSHDSYRITKRKSATVYYIYFFSLVLCKSTVFIENRSEKIIQAP